VSEQPIEFEKPMEFMNPTLSLERLAMPAQTKRRLLVYDESSEIGAFVAESLRETAFDVVFCRDAKNVRDQLVQFKIQFQLQLQSQFPPSIDNVPLLLWGLSEFEEGSIALCDPPSLICAWYCWRRRKRWRMPRPSRRSVPKP
jgi:hypothetical protein